MASTYTTNLGIEKIGTGEQSGTWGDTTNTNFDILDEAVNGIISITLSSAGSSGSPNSLPITDGASSNGRNKFIEFVDGGDLGGTAYVQLTPNDAEKIVHIRNSLSSSRSIIVFQGTYSASNDFEIVNGADVLLKFNGGGSGATVTDVNVDLTVTGATIATADINGGAIDGTVIGGSTAAAGTFTTFTSNGIDDNADATAITIDSSENVGIGTTSPAAQLNLSSPNNIGGASGTFTNAALKIGTAATGMFFDTNEIHGGETLNFFSRGTDNSVADYIRFSTGGSAGGERVRINSSGNVGIGTTSPDFKLDVQDASAATISLERTGASTSALIFSAASGQTQILSRQAPGTFGSIPLTFEVGGSERLRIDGSGNVGIGSAGNAKLQVFGPSASSSLGTYSNSAAIVSNNAGGYGISFSVDGSGTGYIQAQNFTSSVAYNLSLNSAGGNVGIGTTSPDVTLDVFDTSTAGDNIVARLRYNSSTTANTGGRLQFTNASGTELGYIKSNVESGTAVGLTFGTFSSSATAERMRIDSSGNVGIGTSTVNRKLEIAGNNNAGAKANYLRITDTDTTATAANQQGGIEFYASDSSAGAGVTASIEVVYAGSGGGGEITFNTAANSGAGVSEALRIDESGNLLVGKTATGFSDDGFELRGGGDGRLYVTNTDDACIVLRRDGSDGIIQYFYRANAQVGNISVTTTATAYNTSSDERLKENITDASAGNIDDIRVRSFDWKVDGSHQPHGMVAQELVEVAPEAVTQGQTDDDMWQVDYSKLVPMMIKEIQDLKAEVKALKGA